MANETSKIEASKIRAEVRARQAEDGRKAMAEYEAHSEAVRANTERLRALRLARDAAEEARKLAAKAEAKPVKKAKAKAKPKVKARTTKQDSASGQAASMEQSSGA